MRLARTIILAVLLCSAGAMATPPPAHVPGAAMPDWSHLTPEQRELLLAPVRERWNENPDDRARLYERAQRWHGMTPEQRKGAFQGKQRWDHMDPQQREEARALFGKMRGLAPEQRRALRERWRAMTPEQRREWVQRNPPPPGPP